MSEIYSQAVVTIAAASADAVTDGFLHRRAMHVKFPIPWRPCDPSCPVILRRPLFKDDSESKQNLSLKPLASTYTSGLIVTLSLRSIRCV
jgi:hypothetical protein